MAKNKEKKTFYIVLAIILSVVVLGLSSILIIGIANKGSFRFGFDADNVSSKISPLHRESRNRTPPRPAAA